MAKKPSAGISLLEVLFSIGVVAIGLLGVISVVPVALDQVGRGNTAERSSRLGLNAVMEFHSRNMNVSSNWVLRNRNMNTNTQRYGGTFPPLVNMSSGSPSLPLYRYAFCIDPEFVSANIGVQLSSTTILAPNFFPYYTTSHVRQARMLRVSLLGAINPNPSGTPFPEVLRRPVAEAIFSLQDDLAFDISKDASLPPTPIYNSNARRQNEGGFTWIATLVPREYPSNFDTDRTNDSMNPLAYTLSIVVFFRRDTRLGMFDDQNANGVEDPTEPLTYNESVAVIYDTNFLDSGIRGGEVLLDAASPEAIDVRAGDWVMLARSLPYFIPSDTTPPYVQHFRWYRIVGTDAAPEPGGTLGWTRFVTLQGPDWPVVPVPSTTAPSSQPLPTEAVIVRRVAAVHERTILVNP